MKTDRTEFCRHRDTNASHHVKILFHEASGAFPAFAAFVIAFIFAMAEVKKDGSVGNGFLSSIRAGLGAAVATWVTAISLNAIGDAELDATLMAIGSKLIGGFGGLVSQLLIDWACGDGPGSDLALAFLTGGASAAIPGFNNYLDAGFGELLGGGTNALQSIWSAM